MQCYPFIHTDDPDCTEAADDLQLVCAHDCPAQPLQWLWPEKIPLGKVTLLIGDPGTGKSLMALDIAARASRAADWPGMNNEARMTNDETANQSSFDIRHSSFPTNPKSESSSPAAAGNPQSPASPHSSFDIRHPSFPHPASTILLSASDDLADTIRPRLDAAGADPRRVFVIPSIADLRDDFLQLRAAVNRAPNCRLIIIDPINAYVGPGDSHFQTVVRRVLAPLARLAAEKSIAVIAIAHLRKNEGNAIYRAAGSMGFVAAARAVWSVSRDPENPSRHLLLPVKNNVGPDACGLAYTIQPTGPLAAPALVWDPTPIHREHMTLKLRRQDAADLHPVRLWLRETLAHGPRAARELLDAAAQFGFHERTVRRALHALGGHTQHRGVLDGWWWSLPPEPNDETRMTNDETADHSSFDIRHSSFPTNPQSPASPQTTEKTVPLCPLPEIPSAAPATTTAPWPEPNDETRMTNDETADHSSFDIRHSSFPANPQSPASPQTTEKTVPLCPLPEIPSAAPATTTAPWPEPNDETRMTNDETADHSSFDIRHSSFPAASNPQAASSSPAAAGDPKSPPVPQSIAALNRLDRQRRNDRRLNARANRKRRPSSATGHPILDAILDEFRKPRPTTAPQHPTPDTS